MFLSLFLIYLALFILDLRYFPHCREASRELELPYCLCGFLFLLWILCFICSPAEKMWLWSWGELCSVTLLFFPLCPYLSPREILRLPSFKKSFEICCWQSFHEGWLFDLISITSFFSHLCFDSYHCLHQHKFFCVAPFLSAPILSRPFNSFRAT